MNYCFIMTVPTAALVNAAQLLYSMFQANKTIMSIYHAVFVVGGGGGWGTERDCYG